MYLSHKSKAVLPLPDSLEQKPLVTRLNGSRAFFEDGTSEEIDDILFCTGYNYTFPFLSSTCGVKIVDNYVHPLYKQIVSIEHPTLAFIGLPFTVCPFPLFDIQVIISSTFPLFSSRFGNIATFGDDYLRLCNVLGHPNSPRITIDDLHNLQSITTILSGSLFLVNTQRTFRAAVQARHAERT